MKRLIFILFILTGSVSLFAQAEVPSDDKTFSIGNASPFGDFLMDASLLKLPQLPKLNIESLLGPDLSKDYSMLFQLDPKMTFTQGSLPMNIFGPTHQWGMFSGSEQLQMGSFQLNDNVRLNLYGHYKADGTRMHVPGAFPWQRNNFVGGMELKTNNGFGIKIEVRQGHYPPYPY